MKIIFITLLISFLSLNNKSVLHPIHISVTNVYYNDTEKLFDVSIKLFTDDFEKIINENYNTKLNLGKTNENKGCNEFIDKYIHKNLSFKINNENLIKSTKLFEKRLVYGNVIWLYYKIKFTPITNKKIIAENSLMNDLYSDQKNLFMFTYKNTKEANKFEKNNTKFEFFIKE